MPEKPEIDRTVKPIEETDRYTIGEFMFFLLENGTLRIYNDSRGTGEITITPRRDSIDVSISKSDKP